jgi:hypothetical protein
MTETIDTVTSRIQLPASFIRPASYVFRPLIDNTRPLSMGREITEFPLPFYRQEQIFSFTPAYSADSTASDAWSLFYFRAEDEARTRYPQLGRLMLYQMSYFRLFKNFYASSLLSSSSACLFPPETGPGNSRYLPPVPFKAISF